MLAASLRDAVAKLLDIAGNVGGGRKPIAIILEANILGGGMPTRTQRLAQKLNRGSQARTRFCHRIIRPDQFNQLLTSRCAMNGEIQQNDLGVE